MRLAWIMIPLILIGTIGISESLAEESPIDTRQGSLWTGDFTFNYPSNWRLDESFRDTFDTPVHERSVLDSAFSRSVPGMPLISIYHLYGHTYGDFDDQQYLELLASLSKKHCDDSFEIYGYTCTDYLADAKIIYLDDTKAYQIIHTWTESNDDVDIQRTSVIMDFIKGSEIWTVQSINRSVDGEYFVPHGEIDLSLNSFKFTNYTKFDVERIVDYDSTVALYDATIAKIEKSFSEQSRNDSGSEFLKEITLKNMLKKYMPIILAEQYTNTELGFSISYPKGWYVHDEVISYPFTLGVDSGTDVFVVLSPKPYEDNAPYIAVMIIKDYLATKHEDTAYLNYIMDEMNDICNSTKRFYEFECTNHSILSVGFHMLNGTKAIGFKDTWTNVYDDGSPDTISTGITLDVITGKNVWRIVSDNFPVDGEYLVSDRIMSESVRSFEFIDSVVTLQTDSTSIEIELEEPTCGVGTELVNGICQVIKTDEKTSDETSFLDKIFGFFKNLFN